MRHLLTIILTLCFATPVFADGVNVRRKKKRVKRPKVVKVYKPKLWKDRSLLTTDMEMALSTYQRPLIPLLEVPVFAGEIPDTYTGYSEEFVTPALGDSDNKWAFWLIPLGVGAALIPFFGDSNVPVGVTPTSVPVEINPTTVPTQSIPEPTTLILLGSGLVAVFFITHRSPRCTKCSSKKWNKHLWPNRWICVQCGHDLRFSKFKPQA